MVRWEYLHADVPRVTDTYRVPKLWGGWRTEKTQRRAASSDSAYMSWLNGLGEQGWEVVVLEYSYGLFKRPMS